MATEQTAEDKELKALLEIKLEGLQQLGSDDPAFHRPEAKPAAAAAPKKPEAAPKPAMAVSSEPFSRSLNRITERTMIQKAALANEQQAAVNQVHEAYDLICLGENAALGPMRAVANSLLEAFRRDPQAMLALSLSRAVSVDYQSRHAVNVAVLTMATATAAGYSKAAVLETGLAALLADVGMRLVPDEILNKSGKLTDEEMAEIHRHPGYSVTLIQALDGATPLLSQVAFQHHERLTGGGYPERKSGANIIPEARMVAIADTLAAMVHKRSHRDALLSNEALERVIKMGQMNFLEWEFLKGLVGFLSMYPLGSAVELVSGKIARVVEANAQDPARPVVSVLKEAGGALGTKAAYRVDLKTARDEKIVRCIDPEAAGFKVLEGF